MQPQLEVTGFDEVPGTLARITAALGMAPMSGAAEEALQPVLALARDLVPVDSGNLRDSLQIAPEDLRQQGTTARRFSLHPTTGVRQGGMLVGVLEADEFYAWFVEFGTVHSAAQPFLTPAIEAEQATVFDILGKRAGQLILQAVP